MDIKLLGFENIRTLKFACLKALIVYFKKEKIDFDCIEYLNQKTFDLFKEKFNITNTSHDLSLSISKLASKNNIPVTELEDYVKSLFDVVVNNTFRTMNKDEKEEGMESHIWFDITDDVLKDTLMKSMMPFIQNQHIIIDETGLITHNCIFRMNFENKNNGILYDLVIW